MTSLERVFATIHGKKRDRPAYTFLLSSYGAQLTNIPTKEYYTHSNLYVEGQHAVYDLCSPDILFGPFALALEAAAFGAELHHIDNAPPVIKKPQIRSTEEFLKHSLPDIESNPHLTYIRNSIRTLAIDYKDSVPICAVVASPADLPALVLGMEQWIETLVTAPEAARAIMHLTSKHFVSFANALLSDGASFIAVPTMFSSPVLVYKSLIDELILPTLHSAFTDVNGPIVFHHGGNKILSNILSYSALPNVAGFALDSHDSLSAARTIIGPHKLILGNLNSAALSKNTTERIIQKVQDILTTQRNDAHFIFATSSADVPWDTPPERIKAVAQAIQSWHSI